MTYLITLQSLGCGEGVIGQVISDRSCGHVEGLIRPMLTRIPHPDELQIVPTARVSSGSDL